MNYKTGAYDTDSQRLSGPTFTTDQFRELELVGTVLQYKDSVRDYWERIGIGGSISARAFVTPDGVFIGACDKNFYCLDKNGKEKWRFQTNGVIMESADVSETMVYFGSADQNVYALDVKTGKEIWRFKTNGIVPQKPVVHGGRVYIGSTDKNLYCLDAHTGKKIWGFHVKEGSILEPLIVNNRIHFCAKDNTYYCCTLDGNLVWRFLTNGSICGGPAFYHNGKLYIGCWDQNVYCLNETTGERIWAYKANAPTMIPVVWNNRVYAGCWDKTIYCLDAETGKRIWAHHITDFPSYQVVLQKGLCIFGTADNKICGIDAETGTERWTVKTNGMNAQLMGIDGTIYAGCWDCKLYCIDAATGNVNWVFHTSMSTPSPIEPPTETVTSTVEHIIPIEDTQEEQSRYKEQFSAEGSGSSVYKSSSQYIKKHRYGGGEE
ncbi:MAG: PQQ-binding-like beta-propeller repeat protein [Nanoarchaeota archaeon]|nr:PQQ-binding-like beta-propeller repeat protein [Nanoarchaeota archaeon]